MSDEERDTDARTNRPSDVPGPGPAGPGPAENSQQDAPAAESSEQPAGQGDQPAERRGISRRQLLTGAAGGAAAGILLGAGGSAAVRAGFGHGAGASAASAVDTGDDVDLARAVAFYDQPHPAGIETEPQRYTVFMTFDLIDGATADQLRSLLAEWTAAIGQMAQGRPIGPIAPAGNSSTGIDTGEADNLAPASLTVTVGLGPGVFGSRFGLTAKKPPLLAKLPALPGDYLDPAQSDGDLSVQACADDPQVAYHAVRNLARMTETIAHTRWVVMGFGRASAGEHQQTPRNLLGFKDGTRNLKTPSEFKQFVWLRDQGWMTGGTYQVVRKIRMIIENWDSDRISDQENVFGRTKVVGAPLTGTKEFDTPNFKKLGSSGQPVIDPRAHIALAAHENNGGVRILRRSYNYTDGLNSDGLLDAGLLFIAYMDDPQHFIQLQTKLGASDLLNEYIQHIGSGIFAIPPAPRRGGYIGEALFE